MDKETIKTNKKSYKCPICGRDDFFSEYDANLHARKVHRQTVTPILIVSETKDEYKYDYRKKVNKENLELKEKILTYQSRKVSNYSDAIDDAISIYISTFNKKSFKKLHNEILKIVEERLIVRVLSMTSGNLTHAASYLGMKVVRLKQLMKKYKIEKREML